MPEIIAYQFEGLTVDLVDRELVKIDDPAGKSLLRREAFELLVYLVEHRDRWFSPEQLWRAIRKQAADLVFLKRTITQDIHEIRTALDDARDCLESDKSKGKRRFTCADLVTVYAEPAVPSPASHPPSVSNAAADTRPIGVPAVFPALRDERPFENMNWTRPIQSHASVLLPVDLARKVTAFGTTTRESLEPAFIPRLSRDVVLSKYLPAIRSGVISDSRRQFVVIIAPAGFGKTTALGEIYDRLLTSNTSWVGVIRCGDLPPSFGPNHRDLDGAFGRALCGEDIPIQRACEQMGTLRGRGVILIDTLDLILRSDIVWEVGRMFSAILATGTTLACTCRDYEYSEYLEPTRDKLPGLADAIDRYSLPEFTLSEDGADCEVVRAAELFFGIRSQELSGDPKSFARSITRLSADNKGLQELVRNPLFLGMLCDLFGQAGLVPPDLSVSGLYDRYWEERVARGRRDGSVSPLATLRQGICLDIASHLYGASEYHFVERLPELELNGLDRHDRSIAYQQLLSEGVLVRSDRGMVSFYHQTLLEYVMARWLSTHASSSLRERFLDHIYVVNAAPGPNWWPVVRQFLTLLPRSTWERIYEQTPMETSNLGFRMVALAAAARIDGQALETLASHSWGGQGGKGAQPVWQGVVIETVELVPRTLALSAWEVTCAMIRNAEWPHAVNATKAGGKLLARWQNELEPCSRAGFDAIESRPNANGARRTELYGWLIGSAAQSGNQIRNPLLNILCSKYEIVGNQTAEALLRLVLISGDIDTKMSFLIRAIRFPVRSRNEDAATLLHDCILRFISTPDGPFGSTLESALAAELAQGWSMPQSKAVGLLLAKSESQLALFLGAVAKLPRWFIPRGRDALAAAARHGAGASICVFVLRLCDSASDDSNRKCCLELTSALVLAQPTLAPELLECFQRVETDKLEDKLPAWIALASHVHTEFANIISAIVSLPDDAAVEWLRRVAWRAASIPSDALQVLVEDIDLRIRRETDTTLRRKLELIWVDVVAAAAVAHTNYMTELLVLCASKSETVARAASGKLAGIVSSQPALEFPSILVLLKSSSAGVRVRAIRTLTQWIAAKPFSSVQIDSLLTDLEVQSEANVMRLALDLLTRAIKAGTSASIPRPSRIIRIADSYLTISFDPGLVRSAIKLLKALVEGRVRLDDEAITPVAIRIVCHIDLERVRDGEAEMADLLSNTARIFPYFLSTAIDHYLAHAPCFDRNGNALVWAAKRVDGPFAVALDRLLHGPSTPPQVRFLIESIRGE